MIRSEVITEFPVGLAEWLCPYSKEEYENAKEFLPNVIRRAAEVRAYYDGDTPVLVVGVDRASLFGARANLWFLLCRGFTQRHIRAAKAQVGELVRRHNGLQVVIEDAFIEGRKFARFLGFERTEIVFRLFNGRDYHLYEAF